MKKSTILLALSSLFIISCGAGAADKKSVCECEELYSNMKKQAIDYRLNEKLSSEEADKKAMEDNKVAWEKCQETRKEVSDHDYFELSKECGSAE